MRQVTCTYQTQINLRIILIQKLGHTEVLLLKIVPFLDGKHRYIQSELRYGVGKSTEIENIK